MPLSFLLCIFLRPLFIESFPQKDYSPLLLNTVPNMAISNFLPFLIFFILSNPSLLITSQPANGTLSTITNSTQSPPPPPPQLAAAFKPGIAAIVGILTTIFSITFLLLLYVKHCKGSTYANTYRGYPPSRRNSGINRKVIESLPMFRFSSLRGQKDGLECAVCLNKFEAEEVLRLLPKCKHAFHVECVDTWLEAHSTCPLCRYRVDPEDVLLLDTRALYTGHSALATPRSSDTAGGGVGSAVATRISGRHSSAGESGSALGIIAEENPRDDFRGRVSLDSWHTRRKTGRDGQAAENPGRRSKASRKDGQLLVQGDKHRLEHRIIISGGGGEEAAAEAEGVRRWSDVRAADLLYLGSEMLLGGGEEEGKSVSGIINGRSVSEITGMSRYRSNNEGKEERERQEEGVVKRWLAWISQSQHHQNPAVQSATSASPSPILL